MTERSKSEQDAHYSRASRYPQLEKPEFESNIPPHLLGKSSELERWIIESLSRMESVHKWLVKAALDGNKADIENDLRTQELEDWKAMLCSKWAVVGGFLLLILPILLQKLADHLHAK